MIQIEPLAVVKYLVWVWFESSGSAFWSSQTWFSLDQSLIHTVNSGQLGSDMAVWKTTAWHTVRTGCTRLQVNKQTTCWPTHRTFSVGPCVDGFYPKITVISSSSPWPFCDITVSMGTCHVLARLWDLQQCLDVIDTSKYDLKKLHMELGAVGLISFHQYRFPCLCCLC